MLEVRLTYYLTCDARFEPRDSHMQCKCFTSDYIPNPWCFSVS